MSCRCKMPNVNVDNVTENHNSKHFLYFIPFLSDDSNKPANKLVSPAMASKSQPSAPTFLSPGPSSLCGATCSYSLQMSN